MSQAIEYEPAPEPDELASLLAWAFVIAFGVWAGWGWLADGINMTSVMLAVVFGLFQIATNLLAVKVRELANRGDFISWLTCLAAFAAMVGTGLMTHESLDHAYAVALERGFVSADPTLMSYLLLVVPFLEPLMFWINKLLVEPRKPKAQGPKPMGLWPMILLMLFGPSSAAQAQTNEPAVEPSPQRQVSQKMSRANVRNLREPDRVQARLLLNQGRAPKEVHAATGVPLSTLKRWAKEGRLSTGKANAA